MSAIPTRQRPQVQDYTPEAEKLEEAEEVAEVEKVEEVEEVEKEEKKRGVLAFCYD